MAFLAKYSFNELMDIGVAAVASNWYNPLEGVKDWSQAFRRTSIKKVLSLFPLSMDLYLHPFEVVNFV